MFVSLLNVDQSATPWKRDFAAKQVLCVCACVCGGGRCCSAQKFLAGYEFSKSSMHAVQENSCVKGQRVFGFTDCHLPGDYYDRTVEEPVVDADRMIVNGKPIQKRKSNDSNALYVEISATGTLEIELDRVTDPFNENEPFVSFDNITIILLKHAICEQLNKPAALQRLYSYNFVKENGEECAVNMTWLSPAFFQVKNITY